jgi:hypothetical protein
MGKRAVALRRAVRTTIFTAAAAAAASAIGEIAYIVRSRMMAQVSKTTSSHRMACEVGPAAWTWFDGTIALCMEMQALKLKTKIKVVG